MVREVNNLDEFQAILKEAGDKLVVVDFSAEWCAPCKFIAPYYEELSEMPENSNVIFLKVNVDEAEDVAKFCSILSMPTFMFYRSGILVDSFSGAKNETLLEKLTALRT